MTGATKAPVARAYSDRQLVSRGALVAAATELASEDRHRAFTMRDIAARAGVSTATAYTYFGSREHVLAEAYADWVEALASAVAERPPEGAPVERVRSVMRRAVRGVVAAPELARTFTLALAVDDPSVALIRPRIHAAFVAWLAPDADHDAGPGWGDVVSTLELVFFAAMLSFAHGLRSVDELEATLVAATDLVVST